MNQPLLSAEFELAMLPARMEEHINRLAMDAQEAIADDFKHVRRCVGQQFRRAQERMEKLNG